MEKVFQKLVSVKGHGCTCTPWAPKDLETIQAGGFLVSCGQGIVVVVPSLPWIMCNKIEVTSKVNGNHFTSQVKVAVQCETMGLCVLASLDYNTIAPGLLGNPSPYSQKRKVASKPGNKIHTFGDRTYSCQYQGRLQAPVIRDSYELLDGIAKGDCVFYNRSFVGMVIDIDECVSIIPKEYIDRIVADFECKRTGLGSLGFKFDLSEESMRIVKPQILKYEGKNKIIQGTITAINGFPITVSAMEIATVFDDIYKTNMPLDLWFQIRHRPGDIGTICINDEIIPFEAQREQGNSKAAIYLDAYQPHRRMYYRIVGNYVATMPFRSLLESYLINNLVVTIQPKGINTHTVYLIDHLDPDNKTLEIGQYEDTVIAFQLVKLDNKWIKDLNQISASNYESIQYYNGHELEQIAL